ncbi:MarR family winged helix-turn-helix transcriptional regulator [Rhodococcus chondri]|uniref:MarR family transcriptional regulator n=1 Tax=Rhodococcus chondri TaxID=3065941 RepID=A0ABU7JZY0_9NOCA|nr:MarR family transcriptional regulator [Rhodococcus sp. CC-R104]MEE2035563.1 MarR family transcriptional regulator [Rhodococcus sp. CC-R104]
MENQRSIESDLGYLLTRAGMLVVRATNEALAPLELRTRSYTALSLACDRPDGVPQRQVAADMGLDPSQLVAIIDELEQRKLVARTPDPNDRRNKLIVATAAGRDLCAVAARRSAEVTERYFGSVDPAALDQMREMLGQAVFPDTDRILR